MALSNNSYNSLCNVVADLEPNKYTNDLDYYRIGKIKRILLESISDCSRLIGVRVDLRFPSGYQDLFFDDFDNPDFVYVNRSRAISKFIDSFKSKVLFYLKRKKRKGHRVHGCDVRYVWCREINNSINEHFHVCLFLNKDEFYRLGDYSDRESLANIIIEAWASALRRDVSYIRNSVNFPNMVHYVNVNDEHFNVQINELFQRLCYLAKIKTRANGYGNKTFGCSC